MVVTLDKYKRPLGTCSEKHAHKLLDNGRATLYRQYPFAIIIIKDIDVRTLPEERQAPKCRIKIDPGAKYTGMAIIRESDNAVLFYIQIEHRAQMIVDKMKTRHDARRNRRQRETRYRHPKFSNKFKKKGSKYKATSPRPEGWLPPSVKSIGDNIINWVIKLGKWLNLSYCSFETVRFDAQLLDNPDIEGAEYQHGELFGYEIKEYLLNKYGHTCQYCGGTTGDEILEWEHINPKSKGGSDSVKNATLACHTCNQNKDDKTLEQWLAEQEKIVKDTVVKDTKNPPKKVRVATARIEGIKRVMENKPLKKSDRYCAWVNSSRTYIEKGLFEIFDEVECSSGGRTKYNRTQLKLPKDHHYDALCVGNTPKEGYKDFTNGYCSYIKAEGRGGRLRGNINCCGVITTKYKDNHKLVYGFQNGDIVSANVPKGKYKGHHIGKITTRKTGTFDIAKKVIDDGKLKTIRVKAHWKYCKLVQKCDGYSYFNTRRATS